MPLRIKIKLWPLCSPHEFRAVTKRFIILGFLIGLICSCGQNRETKKTVIQKIPPSNLSGKALAEMHCASCHLLVSPEVLPKTSWKNDVLPAMGNRLGIYNGAHQPDSIFGSSRNGLLVKKANIFPEKPLLAREDWTKLVAYYLQNAPDTVLPPKPKTELRKSLRHFKYTEASFADRPPLTVMVKILPGKKGILFSDSKRNNNILTFLTPNLEKDRSMLFEHTPIHYYQKENTVYVTTIGKNVFPNDVTDGAVQKFEAGKIGKNHEKIVIPNLQRPVDVAFGDLNSDSLQDIVVCEYGDLTGKLVWYENLGKDAYAQHILSNKPGAIKAIIKDYNGDGWNDIFALMAQGDESIFYYENLGTGAFTAKRLLTFSPLNGSQYMELADFNGDGHDDILYVCGDNADKTPILKDYHGTYVFLTTVACILSKPTSINIMEPIKQYHGILISMGIWILRPFPFFPII